MSLLIQVRLPGEEEDAAAIQPALRLAGLRGDGVTCRVWKKTFDLRRGRFEKNITVLVEGLPAQREEALGAKEGMRRLMPPSLPVPAGTQRLTGPPVIIGFGPAGLFSALILAEQGYRPIVLERGSDMTRRDLLVDRFFGGGALDPECNIQFGEGGAGAYSDGKLTTRIDDPRCNLVTKLLMDYGAEESVFVAAKPHIGTDLLKPVVVSIRKRIEALGGRVLFDTAVTGLEARDGILTGVRTQMQDFACQAAILAIGHSARDTFRWLAETGVAMEPKAFSAGVRIEHLQRDIDAALYGGLAGSPLLPPGEYALTAKGGDRGCYSFCMCPGGQVIPAASETGMQVTNGMSRHARDGENANSALCVTVSPRDYGSGLLDGVAFQRELEGRAFRAGGNYAAPVQTLGDFAQKQRSKSLGRVRPSYPRETVFFDLSQLLPSWISETILAAIGGFGKKLRGFDAPDALMTGVETRTSSPVRILRGEDLESLTLRGLIPCGEGAGYAGGIMSAAVDGIRCAEAVMKRWQPDK